MSSKNNRCRIKDSPPESVRVFDVKPVSGQRIRNRERVAEMAELIQRRLQRQTVKHIIYQAAHISKLTTRSRGALTTVPVLIQPDSAPWKWSIVSPRPGGLPRKLSVS